MDYLVVPLSTANNIYFELHNDRLIAQCAAKCICFGAYASCRLRCSLYVNK